MNVSPLPKQWKGIDVLHQSNDEKVINLSRIRSFTALVNNFTVTNVYSALSSRIVFLQRKKQQQQQNG